MKRIDSYIKIQIPSQEANTNPPIGPILGQKGINIMSFCKDFNKKTENIEKGLLLSVKILIYIDKTFDFIIKSTPTSILIKKELGIELGSSNPGKNIIGEISKDQIINISKIKISDTLSSNIESVCNSVIGTAKSMGIKIIL